MNRLRQLIDKLRGFESSVFAQIEAIIRDNEAFILEMNTEDQLYEGGQNRLGVPLSDFAPYRPMTIEIKRQKGQPTGRVTLRDSGDFHRSFYIEYLPSGFAIRAEDDKTVSLTKKYGKEIFGLSDENKEILIKGYIEPELFKRIKALI